jgi:hypothetical protein
MGLDWNPLGRPKPGHEAEFERLFKRIAELPTDVSWLGRVFRRLVGAADPEAIRKRWFEIQTTAFETLEAPKVGKSADATAWALERYREQKEPKRTEQEFLKEMDGFYVVTLAPPCDGIPVYSNGEFGYVERFSFRGQFLIDCKDIIGEALLEKCYVSCLAPGLAALGHELRAWALSYAGQQGVLQVEHLRSPDGFEENSPESKAHILFSAARWCEYWSSRGHGLEAYW